MKPISILIAPDKFKGSLTSFEVVKALSNGLQSAGVVIKGFPFADGGDGFAAVMKYYLQTTTCTCDAVDPLHRKITVAYEWDEKNKTAIIEMAVASGLVLLKEAEKNPLKTSTLGTGMMIKDAIAKGAKKIILGLGGSATNDAGIGILSALGFQFYDAGENMLPACGSSLISIKKIIAPAILPDVKFEIACDVQNVLYGPNGAAYVYAPQKGADKEMVALLDSGLKNFAGVIEKSTGRTVASAAGAGAAGGIAAGLMAFFDVVLVKGVELVATASGIKKQLSFIDMIITGEGKIDNQSNEGKVTGYMAGLAKQYSIPCVAFCGIAALTKNESTAMGLNKIVSLAENESEVSYAIEHAAKLLQQKAHYAL
ncbi:MAG: glycerate kinase [Chitinophagaceae bacterium]